MTKTDLVRRDIDTLIEAGVRPKDIVSQLRVSKSLVFKIQQLKRKGKSTGVEQRSGRPRKRVPELLDLVEATYEDDPTVTYVQTAKKLGVSRWTIAEAVKDVGMQGYVRSFRALITTKSKQKRIERSEDLIEWIDGNPSTGEEF